MAITIKNAGKGVAKIRRVNWSVASETGAWNIHGSDSTLDSIYMGPGDLHNLY